MRPTTGTMLQQNNNNNYPCLSMSDCPQEMLQKCPRTSLPFPSRVELGLGDLPLIRGLRAWALCSKNRRKAGGLLGGGKPPTAPPLAKGTSMTCPRPADVYLSGYGLPLGLDARQAGIGALVTVATLKTSEGSGKTQTQCLFLRTEKGSCLYSTAKPSTGASPSMVGEWLRGKRGGGEGGGGGGTDPPTAEAGANRVRMRSGRRWRKSGNAAGQERKAVSRERQQRSCKRVEPREGKQEEQDKGCMDGKQFHCPQLDNSRGGACNNVSPKTCTPKNSWDECEGGESMARGAASELNLEEKEAKRERQRNEGAGGVSNAVLDASNQDLELIFSHKNSSSSSDADEDQEIRQGEGLEELKTQTSHLLGDLTRRDEEANTGMSRTHESSRELILTPSHSQHENEPKQETEQEPDKEMKFIARTKESSLPAEGSVCSTDQSSFWVYSKQESNQNQLHVELGPEAEHKGVVEEETNIYNLQPPEPNSPADESNTVNKETTGSDSQQEEKGILSPPVNLQKDLSICKNLEEDIRKLEDECTCSKLHDGSSDEKEQRSSTSGDDWSLPSQEPGGKKEGHTSSCAETNGQKSIVVCNGADPPASNPAPSLLPLASMVTGLPCLDVEAGKEEVEGHEGGGHKQSSSPRGVLEEKAEEVRSSTVATEEGRNQEEEDEFGVFMQAEAEATWSEGVNMSASVPCGSRGSIGLGKHASTEEDDWTAFPQDPSDESRDAVEQWWPASAVEARRDGSPANHSLVAVFADAFPSLAGFSPGDLEAVPTLTQLLREGARQEQGLLDSFHDLNKMIGQSNRRSNNASQNLLLKTLQLQQPLAESRPTSWTNNRRLSPGLSSANQHLSAKRRLSYDYNRNVVE